MPTYDGSGFWPAHDGLSPDIAEFLSPREASPLRDSVIAAFTAGVVGSAIAGALLVGIYMRSGGGALLPARILCLQLLGDARIAASAPGIALSAFAWLAGGAAFGALFGVVMSRFVGRVGLMAAVGVGAVYGVLVWIVTQFVVIAYIAPLSLLLYDQQTLALSFGVYGACLGILGRARGPA